ncbi:Formate hydrogenlyase maturation protein HycH [Edwardsiella anguillarum]|uniref:formate hydrogenlyase maturation HycH family protein n=1 Tax=Edwardsiella TaxID=635 RepID=UPI00045CDF7C|nr:formate hydrogenlyase maturation HycH family protein [Edwardsiella anguillarum]AKM46923.1 formate hydrogenlyase maturation protein HycH [Edwardsiella sp. EA181011]GAJ68202.1 formate hydrogenlyase maturation protein HycH [Edwardsiella piscicida]RFT04566.1 formate hydrogenlyase maturation protein HycH [Edwardsiella anguillarum]BET81896.1 Formate hydrogenlyase maturation protein HycH [Edwardsiella anguillarum]BET85325.1 Formate hydrogenlyase maturation protein HycH [Edwardsiella anguillarum]
MTERASAYFPDPTVVFHILNAKFVQQAEDEAATPPAAREVIYYSLAIGHHLGVIDCLKPCMSLPLSDYRAWIAQLETGEARRKLEGVLRFGEIGIDISHIHTLACALDRALPAMTPPQQAWSRSLIDALQLIENEPTIYLMVKRHNG